MTVLEERAYNAIIKMAHRNEPDYWERLKHQYVGMAMQGLMSILPHVGGLEGRSQSDEVTEMSISIATKLIERLKEEK